MDSRGSMITGSSVVRVLLIDNDVESSRSVKKMLKECDYKVITSDSLQQGLELLNDRKDGFDIVMCDIDARMGEVDSFSFVRQMDLPVVMMSGDKDDSKVIKSFEHGACAYLRKPIIIEEVHRIWHLVVQKQMAKGRLNEIQIHGAQESDLSNRPSSSSERKDVDNGNPSTSSKKTRVVWSAHLHHKFVEAVNKIGLQKACPKKILNLMGSEGLTRENVASHLQKYRLSLQRKKLDPIPTPVQQQQQQQDHSDLASRGHPVDRCNQTWGHPVYLGHQTLPDQSAMIMPMERNVVAYGAALPTLVQTDNVTNSCGTTLDHNASLYPDADAVPFLPNPNYAMDQCSQLDYYSSCVNPICSSHWIPSSAPADGDNVFSVPWGTLVPSSYMLSSHINDVAPCHQTNSIVVVGADCNDRPTLTHHLETNLHLSGSGPHTNADLGSDNCIYDQYGDQFLDF